MKEIRLTQNRVALVDDEDFEGLNRFKWHCMPHGKNFYARGAIWHPDHPGDGYKKFLMHRIIMRVVGKKGSVDHIDGNGLNNQRKNLRICSHTNNCQNRSKNKNGSSKFKGVSFHKRDKIYCAGIKIDGKERYIGSYDSEIEAALAYNVSASFAFREFARLNKIEV